MRIALTYVPATIAFLVSAALLAPIPGNATPPAAPPNGPRRADPTSFALVGGTVHPRPGIVVERGVVVVRDGIVRDVIDPGTTGWTDPTLPVIDATGQHIYAGFIEPYLEIDVPAPKRDQPGAHWSARVTPQRSALDASRSGRGGPDAKVSEGLRKLGFVAAAITPKGGTVRGSSAVVSLAQPDEDPSRPPPTVYRGAAYHSLSFEPARGGSSPSEFGWDGYPDSQMGAIALIRQTLLDADHRATTRPASGDGGPDCLDALDRSARRPLLFETTDELEALRAAKIAGEMDRPALLLGSGFEFRRLAPIARDGLPIILPLNFPEDPKVGSVSEAESTDLRTLMTWEQAPANPARLIRAGTAVAFTTHRLKDRSVFAANLRKAVAFGLTEDLALEALTVRPAEMLGVSDRLGTIAKGMAASLIVADGPLFRKKTKIREVYIEGARHEITPRTSEIAGTWEARGSDGARWRLLIDHENVIRVELPGTGDTLVTRKARQTSLVDSRVSFVAELGPSDSAEPVVLSALAQGESMIGAAVASGRTWTWEAARTSKELPKPRPSAAPTDPSATTPPVDSSETRDRTEGDRPDSVSSVSPPDTTNGLEADEPEFGALAEGVPEPSGFPFGPYSVPAPPGAARVAIVGATVWTSGPRGTIAGGVVYVDAGKIRFVGDANEWTRFARELGGAEPDRIDATGKHLTPGLIDCHSHTGISKGVNEAGQAVTAEVRIADVTDPDAINWYRQLAGGLTVVNSLHGSANPIGGQNCVNKIRWGVERPDDMHMEGVVGGIKFALGENVTQANWSDRAAPRYPRTRMGVETLLRDRFAAAREYAGVMEAWAARGGRPGDRPRRDLELEALAEVLAGTRLVHCHSYRQDEILMLCRVAGEFGFTIGTFQHGLECYKVADEVKRSALGASLFSDWWSYKVEVQDAIPQAGPILHERGVVVSYNSDSDEMARRMNTEAAKAARYGDGLSPEDALKFVTINPARQLKIDARTGSIEAGKDADLALWSGDPLSAFSRCEATWVDGRALFSLEADARARETIAKERTRLLAKLLAEKKKTKPKADRASDEKDGAPGPRERAAGEGDHLAQLRLRNLDLLRRGIDPGSMPTDGCGDCGQSETRDR